MGQVRVAFAGEDSIFARHAMLDADTLAVAFLYNTRVDVPEQHWADTYRAFTGIFS